MYFADSRNKRQLAFLMAAFFLTLQASVLLTPQRAQYPAMSSSGVSAYLLMVDMSNDSVYAAGAQSRSRRSAQANPSGDIVEYGVFPRETVTFFDEKNETSVYPHASQNFALAQELRFNVVSRK
ncbi:MAG: hypothetical protein LBS45_10280 [Synergistaceae bacterium]|nr:hypothetical protein [Synergistaceae bacterium]